MSNLIGDSSNPQVAAISGKHTTQGIGVQAESAEKWAIRANAPRDTAIFATSDAGMGIDARSKSNTGVNAFSEEKWAVRANAPRDTAIYATSDAGIGIDARSKTNFGIVASSEKGGAIRAKSHEQATAIWATADAGIGIDARSTTNTGVNAFSEQGLAVRANAPSNTAIYATSGTGIGMQAESAEKWAIRAIAPRDTAIFATSDAGIGIDARSKTNTGVNAFSEQGSGIYAKGGTYAGYFEGIVMVTGDVQLQNADCAEDFDIPATEQIEPGSVVVISSEGSLRQSTEAYDKKVAGVISGAGDYKPGMVLDRQTSQNNRMPVSLMGKVYCKVDAQYAPIEVGDLLTTSPTPGHAMKATDPIKAFGAVLGKALRPLGSGRDLIPILVALQ